MSIYFVDESVLQKRLECVLCPTRGSQLFKYKEICGKIHSLADKDKLERAFELVEPCEYCYPTLTSGFNLSDYVVHIFIPEMSASKHFEYDIFKSYHRVVQLILMKGFKTIVFPTLPYAYKRLGSMNAYRTQKTLLTHFSYIYNIETDIYILIDRRSIDDHLNNYVSTYVSTSYPLSKRHSPLDYPLVNETKLNSFLDDKYLEIEKAFIEDKNYFIEFKENKFSFLYKEIQNNYDDNTFCFLCNMNKMKYIMMFEGDYIPCKTELIGISLALSYDVNKTNELLSLIDESLNETDIRDRIIIDCILENDFDVMTINEKLFVLSLEQIGSKMEI